MKQEFILHIIFFCTNSGAEPVKEWLQSLEIADRKIIGNDLKTVQFGWPLGMPLVRKLTGGLWEVRSRLTGGKIGRTIFCLKGNRMILLHGFIKKSQKTPKQDIEMAKKRYALLRLV